MVSSTEQLNDPGTSVYTLGVRAIHHWAYMELDAAIELGLRSDAIAKENGLFWRRGQVAVFVAMALRFAGRESEALALLDEDRLLALAERDFGQASGAPLQAPAPATFIGGADAASKINRERSEARSLQS